MVEQIRHVQIGRNEGLKMKTRSELEQIAKDMRKDVLRMALHAGTKGAHIGGSMSSMEILAVLYGAIMKYDAKNPEDEKRDRFIMSKAHSAIGLYAALRYANYLSEEDIAGAMKGTSFLYKHPKMDIAHGLEFSGGSLGQGLSLGVGSALAIKRKGNNTSNIYVLLGDGECDEGSVWEAAATVIHYNLKNLTTIIDMNGLQNDGRTSEVLNIGNMVERWKSMGFDVLEVNGHDVMELQEAFLAKTEHPKAIVCHTIKGRGIRFAEDKVDWHIGYVTQELYDEAMEELK